MSGLERIPPRKEFKRWLPRLTAYLWECEHYRTFNEKGVPVGNVAVVVLRDGRAFVATAKHNPKDAYNRKRGYGVAMGRALKEAVITLEAERQLTANMIRAEQAGNEYMVVILNKAAQHDLDPANWHDFTAPTGMGGIELRDYCRTKVVEGGWGEGVVVR